VIFFICTAAAALRRVLFEASSIQAKLKEVHMNKNWNSKQHDFQSKIDPKLSEQYMKSKINWTNWRFQLQLLVILKLVYESSVIPSSSDKLIK